MADWVIRWGIPLTLVSVYLVAVVVSGGRPTTLCYEYLNWFRNVVQGAIPRLL